MRIEIIRAMVQHILENPHRYEWSLQGFGMLRTYLPFDMRLNIWNRQFRVPNVSLIHTHPWHFDSYIERGRLNNLRFQIENDGEPPNYQYALIKPGPSGGLREHQGRVRLSPLPLETYDAGQAYHQNAHEIHLSDPDDGTVTINARSRIGPDEALVFWSAHSEWVSAEPRSATADEVEVFVRSAVLALPNN